MRDTIVWIDRDHARVFHFGREKANEGLLHATRHQHHAPSRDRVERERSERTLYNQVAAELNKSRRILVIGPGVAKHHFHTFLFEHHPVLARKISAVETVDHPSEAQVSSLALKHFELVSA